MPITPHCDDNSMILSNLFSENLIVNLTALYCESLLVNLKQLNKYFLIENSEPIAETQSAISLLII